MHFTFEQNQEIISFLTTFMLLTNEQKLDFLITIDLH